MHSITVVTCHLLVRKERKRPKIIFLGTKPKLVSINAGVFTHFKLFLSPKLFEQTTGQTGRFRSISCRNVYFIWLLEFSFQAVFCSYSFGFLRIPSSSFEFESFKLWNPNTKIWILEVWERPLYGRSPVTVSLCWKVLHLNSISVFFEIYAQKILKTFSIFTGGYSGKTTAGISGVFIFFTGIGYDRFDYVTVR